MVRTGLDHVLPLKTKTVFTTGLQRINPTLKRPIRIRQRALSQGNVCEITSIANARFAAPSTMRAKYNTSRSATRHAGGKKSRDLRSLTLLGFALFEMGESLFCCFIEMGENLFCCFI